MKRRAFIGGSAAASVALLASKTGNAMPVHKLSAKLKNNINHSVCRWCYNGIPLEDFLKSLNELGIKAIDLTGPEEWPLLKKYNIHASMCQGAGMGIDKGWNDPKYHEELIKDYLQMIPKVAEAGYTNLICFSGNRRGMDDQTGLQNCAEGLKKLMPMAEKHGVVIIMELLNSKVDHKDYMCDEFILAHERLHFDISELYARKMRRIVSGTTFTGNVKEEVRAIYKQVLKELSIFQNKYDYETNFSRNVEKQLQWNRDIEAALREPNG